MGVPGGLGAGYGGNRPEPPLRCRHLAATIDDWGKIPHHNRYVRDLLRAYDHRPGFLNKLSQQGTQLQARQVGVVMSGPMEPTPHK